MRTFAALLAVLLAGFALAGPPARAEGATLIVNDQAIVTFKTGSGPYSPAKRAMAAAVAINSSSETEFTSVRDGSSVRMMLGSTKVFTIDRAEARAHRTTAVTFGRLLATKLNSALDSVPFVLESHRVWMPVGGTATVAMTGPAAGKVAVTFDSTGPAKAVQKDGMITLTATYEGECRMTVKYGEQEETLAVSVQLPAATIGAPETAFVTGRPADKATVAQAAVRAAVAAVHALPGARIEVSDVEAPELVPAQRGTARVHVTVSAPDRFPVSADVSVDLKDTGMIDNPSEELWYSNHPENLTGPARLYWGKLGGGRAARVLYHHQNAAQRPVTVTYMLVNPGETEARVAVTLGDAPPQSNPTYAGYVAGQEFFPRWVRQSAAVTVVPPHSAVAVVCERVGPGLTASGLMALHSLDGNSVLFIGESDWATGDAKGNVAATLPAVSLSDHPMNLVGQSGHVYSPATKSLEVNYEVGGRFGYIRIGQEAVKRVDDEGKLDGNFGIVYQVKATVSNMTPDETEVEFVFESSAGYTGAFFRINEVLYSTPLLQPKKTFQFMKVKLAPGESKVYMIETIPLSGGSYPATVTIKPVGVQ